MSRTAAGKVAIVGAAGAVWLLAATAAEALQVRCSASNSGGRVSVIAQVDNDTGAPLQQVGADPIVVTSIGSASLLVQVTPRPLRTLLAGRRAGLQWSGRAYGNGYLNLAVRVTARAGDGRAVASALVGCARLAVGDPERVGRMTPGSNQPCGDCHSGPPDPLAGNWTAATAHGGGATRATRTPTRPRPRTPTFTRTMTPRRQPTPRPVRPTRTRIPTATRRPTRTPIGGGGNVALPDLTVDAAAVRSSLLIETRSFTANDCAVRKGCVRGTGRRRLLRFTIITPNVGRADLALGDPPRSRLYEWDACYEQYAFNGFWDLRLRSAAGATLARGEKHAWCLVDLFPVVPNSRPRPRFEDCGNQGISAGWADTYGRNVECQWVDITDVPAGTYALDVTVNPARRVLESDYGNNTARIEVTIPPAPRR